MTKQGHQFSLHVRRRPWYAWATWIVFGLWCLFWAEAALGSWQETEPRAYAISLVVLLVSLIVGFHVWLWRHLRTGKT